MKKPRAQRHSLRRAKGASKGGIIGKPTDEQIELADELYWDLMDALRPVMLKHGAGGSMIDLSQLLVGLGLFAGEAIASVPRYELRRQLFEVCIGALTAAASLQTKVEPRIKRKRRHR